MHEQTRILPVAAEHLQRRKHQKVLFLNSKFLYVCKKISGDLFGINRLHFVRRMLVTGSARVFTVKCSSSNSLVLVSDHHTSTDLVHCFVTYENSKTKAALNLQVTMEYLPM